MTVGENIRFLRKQIHMTQQQLADLAGVNVATIRGYESGKYKPKFETVCNLAKAMDCNVNEIIDEPLIPDDFSFDDLEEISDGLRVPKDYSPEAKEYIKELIGDSFSDRNLFESHLKRVKDKIDDGGEIDAADLHFLCNECIQNYYQSLNSDGQKQATKMISDLLDGLEMLQKIPEYKSGKSSGNDTENGTK